MQRLFGEAVKLLRRSVGPRYGFSLLFSMACELMQGPFLDQYIFSLASRALLSENVTVGAFESMAGSTKLVVAVPIGSLAG